MPEDQKDNDKVFGIIAEVEGYSKQLVQLNLPFPRLIDEIVVPYDNNDAVFIDGVPATKNAIKRIKIIEIGRAFKVAIEELDMRLTDSEDKTMKIFGDQYSTRFEHLLRTTAVDVTAQVLKAYNQIIKPSIKDYLPKRQELISGATQAFITSMKILGS